MYLITKRLPKLAGLAMLAFAAACSTDRMASPAPAASAPALNVVGAELPAVVQRSAVTATRIATPASNEGRFHAMAAVYPSNATTYQFTVNPSASVTVIVGSHMVSFPKNTICDPAVSSYGAGTWLTNCAKLTSSITITATTWVDGAGRPQIDFANALRFYPNNTNQLPAIYLRDASASMTSFGRVDYCTSASNGNGNTTCVDESSTDPTLVTQRDATTGYLFRLIRHFSGYNVWA